MPVYGFNKSNGKFYDHSNSFKSFDEFAAAIDYDFYYVDLHGFDFHDVDISKYDFSKSKIDFKKRVELGIYDDSDYNRLISSSESYPPYNIENDDDSGRKLMDCPNSKQTSIVSMPTKTDSTDGNDVFYITDIHLDEKIKKSIPRRRHIDRDGGTYRKNNQTF